MTRSVRIRPAKTIEVDAIVHLNNHFADQHLMLRRTPEMVLAALDDYVVAIDERGTVVGCGALKEYSPSIAEIAAIAVSPAAQGLGLGRMIVNEVEGLARKRGIPEVFALTLEPRFFSALGYQRVDRARYPEKIRRDCIGCSRRFACNETCFARALTDLHDETTAQAA